jgi:hypothetical protein
MLKVVYGKIKLVSTIRNIKIDDDSMLNNVSILNVKVIDRRLASWE